jgi:large subunit ribosomal protein L35e
MGHLKAHELRQKTRGELLEELASQEKKMFELKGQKASGSKLSEIKNARRDIARIKTVLMQKQREALNAKYAKKKYVPLDLRPRVEKSIRSRLSPKYANKMTSAQKRRSKFLHPIKFALKAQ